MWTGNYNLKKWAKVYEEKRNLHASIIKLKNFEGKTYYRLRTNYSEESFNFQFYNSLKDAKKAADKFWKKLNF